MPAGAARWGAAPPSAQAGSGPLARLRVKKTHTRQRPQQCEMAVGGQLWLAYLCMYVRMVTKADWN